MNKNKDKIMGYVSVGLFMLCGFVAGALMPFSLEGKRPAGLLEKSNLVAFLFILFVVAVFFFFHIALHELGHMIGGFISGYKFVSYRIGSIMLAKYDDGFKIKKFSIPGTAGQCLMEPPVYDKNFKYKLYFASGVLANVIVVSISTMLMFKFGIETFWGRTMLLATWIGIYFIITNGIPMKANGIVNDYYNLFFMREEIQIKSFWETLNINAKMQKGALPSELMEEDIVITDEMINGCGDISIAAKLITISSLYVEKGRYEEAYDLLTKVKNNDDLIDLYKNELQCEQIYFELILQNRKEVIDELYTDKIKRYIITTKPSMISRVRLMYAFELLGNNDVEAAKKEKDLFEKMSKNYPNLGDLKLEQKMLSKVDEVYMNRSQVSD
ncbi:MAG: hypothetical protein IKN54_04485 [Lachnospiraceae bacterium]|nr:hypothetical protein [Lachnospiraceae bacterium]